MMEFSPSVTCDYRLQNDSPAIDAGIELPAEWEGPLRSTDRGSPDIGAIPRGGSMFLAGRPPRAPQRRPQPDSAEGARRE